MKFIITEIFFICKKLKLAQHLYNASHMAFLLVQFFIFIFIFVIALWSQDQDTEQKSDYILGEEERLEMKVHVWGEVTKPGEFQVPYDTNILELISKAGGPTLYSNLSKVRLTREGKKLDLGQDDLRKLVQESRNGKIDEQKIENLLNVQYSHRVFEYNLSKYLEKKEKFNPPPVLQPGDVVYVPRNNWHRWREIVRVAHEVAIIASVYVWYLRAK